MQKESDLQVAVGYPVEFQSIGIPQDVNVICVSVGLHCSEDSDDRRGVRIVKTDKQVFPEGSEEYFEHDTEGLLEDCEKDYLERLLEYLATLGFKITKASNHGDVMCTLLSRTT